MKRYILLNIIFFFSSTCIISQEIDSYDIQELNEKNFKRSLTDFLEYLKIPNQSNNVSGLISNNQFLDSIFKDLDFSSKSIYFQNTPYFYAESRTNHKHTILFYLQLDGQPIDNSLWNQPNAYIPVIKLKKDTIFSISDLEKAVKNPKEHYVFARSSSDSKGPVFSLLSALKIIKDNNIKIPYNIKVIGDFKEELGSPTIKDFVSYNKDLLKADGLIIMDGTRHISNLPTLTFGARGIATLNLKYYGPYNNLHSGQYGNLAPNPIFEISRLLAGMKDENGKVLIPGYYDGIEFNEDDLKYFESLNESFDDLAKQIGVKQIEKISDYVQQSFHFPSLNIRGINSGWTGDKVRNIIPNIVEVELEMRLVPEISARKQIDLIKNYIENKGYTIIDKPPSSIDRIKNSKLIEIEERIGSTPFRTSVNSPFGLWLENSIINVLGKNIIKASTTGGSQPISSFIQELNIPAVSVRIPNPDNNIHGPNENINIKNLKEGILICLSILTSKYGQF